MREVDELIFVDITATDEGRSPDYILIDELAVSGGVRSVEEAGKPLQVGADKVCIGTAAVENPSEVTGIAERFGSQCAIVSLDFQRHEDESCEVYTHSGIERPAKTR